MFSVKPATTLMVTHRHSVLEAADLVIMLESGRVIATGPPSEIGGSGGAFDRLWTHEEAPAYALPLQAFSGEGELRA